MEQALCANLLARSSVSSVIGGQLFANVLPQDCNLQNGVAVTYEIISSTDQMLLSDRSGAVTSRVQFVAYATTNSEAMKAARAIKNSGIATLKGVTYGVDIRSVTIDDGIRCYAESPTDGTTDWRYLAELDLSVTYLEE